MEMNKKNKSGFVYVPREIFEATMMKAKAYDAMIGKTSDEMPSCSYCGTPASKVSGGLLIANQEKTSHICVDCVLDMADDLEGMFAGNEEGHECECGGECGKGNSMPTQENIPEEIKNISNTIVQDLVNKLGIDPSQIQITAMPMNVKNQNELEEILKKMDKGMSFGPIDPKRNMKH